MCRGLYVTTESGIFKRFFPSVTRSCNLSFAHLLYLTGRHAKMPTSTLVENL